MGVEAERYRMGAEKHANENIMAVVRCLLDGKRAGAADRYMISVKELLRINAHQVSMSAEP